MISGTLKLIPALVLWATSLASSQGEVVQIHEDFEQDPGWKGFQNRILAEDPPTLSQDFGWNDSRHASQSGGEIGGKFHRSRTIAYYALPFGEPLTLDDRLSAQGTVALLPRDKQGGAYIGFFNHRRQEWRPWNSIAWRIGDYPVDGEIHLDFMAANWMANGLRLPDLLPGDGKPHTWKLEYDPEARVDPNSVSGALLEALPDRPTPESEILANLRVKDPNLTVEQLHEKLFEAQTQGLAGFKNMGKEYHWWKGGDPENLRGRISFQLDGGRIYSMFLSEEHRKAPASFDRFGVFNFQLYGRHWEFYDNESTGVESEFYLADLTLNGEPIDLGTDPHWEGAANRHTSVDDDFHGRHDFGYSQTWWAGGEAPGEVGGTIWRNEAIDPLHSYYADPVGSLTLENPIRFSGKLAFVNGATDGDAIIGYFNEEERKREFTGGNRVYPPDLAEQLGGRANIHLGFDQRGSRVAGTLGFSIGGPTTVGFYFALVCTPTLETASMVNGPVIVPDERLHTFSFDYDPNTGSAGRISASLDGVPFHLDLTPQQRQAGASFDLFGLTHPRQGGKWVTLFLDDLDYTATVKRDTTRFPQGMTRVKYPTGGRYY